MRAVLVPAAGKSEPAHKVGSGLTLLIFRDCIAPLSLLSCCGTRRILVIVLGPAKELSLCGIKGMAQPEGKQMHVGME